MVNVGKYTIHGLFGIGKLNTSHDPHGRETREDIGATESESEGDSGWVFLLPLVSLSSI